MADSQIAALVADLLVVVASLTNYPVPAGQPAVDFAPHAVLEERVCGEPCDILGWFAGDTIYLDDRLDPLTDLQARSVLLHELVHYAQSAAGLVYDRADCPTWAELESEAYAVQFRWLRGKGAVIPYGLIGEVSMGLRQMCDTE